MDENIGKVCKMCQRPGVFLIRELEDCGNAQHLFHTKCLKQVSEQLILLVFLENSECCKERFIGKYSSKEKCLKCKNAVGTSLGKNGCRWKKGLCEQCILAPLADSHRASCQDCGSISCSICNKTVKISMNSNSIRCSTHKYCISCLKSQNSINCQICLNFSTNAHITCALCETPLAFTDISCKSGHFFCKLCLQHFSWTNQNCTSCYDLFKIANERLISVSYYNSLYTSITEPTPISRRCFVCNSTEFSVFQTSKCKNCYYCPNCINQDKLEHSGCKDCIKTFRPFPKTNKKIIVCRICLGVPDGTSSFCEDFHFICTHCRKFLIGSAKVIFQAVLECNKCVKELRALREYAQLYHMRDKKSFISLPEYSFSCGHVIRHDVLVDGLVKKIREFLEMYRTGDLRGLNGGFAVLCGVCGNRVLVPFQKFRVGIQVFFSKEEWGVAQKFSMVFDGLPCVFQGGNRRVKCFIGNIEIA